MSKGKLVKKFAARLSRSALVGAAATLSDLGSLAVLVEGLGWPPQRANVPSLALGAAIQFFGNRYFAFRAKDGHLGLQALGFVAAELASLALNAWIFDFEVTRLGLHFAIARPLGTAAVFLLFSYPLWHWIFRIPKEGRTL